MIRIILLAMIAAVTAEPLYAASFRVPQDHATMQGAIDRCEPGDLVLVAPGKYLERIKLKPGIVVRSVGDDTRGIEGVKRAEATIIDGGGLNGKSPGVEMAEGSTLDGFTITNVGVYDDARWKKHYESKGEDLGDDEGSVQAEGTIPAISVSGVTCNVTNCVVHHNGDVGIGILGKVNFKTTPLIIGNIVHRNMGGGIGVAEGAEAIVRGNRCKENLRAGIGCRAANPILLDNECFGNVRAGIGCREGSRPVIRSNKCHHNRRAGIGIRMKGTAPIVEQNECFKNAMAGIGCRDGATPLIIGNVCRDNEMAGIGLQGKAVATIQRNKCLDNKLVAIGVTEGSSATISENEVSRSGGMPPIIAIKDGSTAKITDNRISGGGVAAILVQGIATINGNQFAGIGAKQGSAVWVWENSIATISDNAFDGYRAAVTASKATVVIFGNTITKFQGTAILVKDSQKPAHVVGNKATTSDAKAKVVDVQGPAGVVADNILEK